MKTPKDQQAGELQLRPGVGSLTNGWLGVNTESDPGSLAPGQLQRGENVRLIGGNILPRPGNIEKVDLSHGVNNAILFLDTAPADNPRTRLWASARGCYGASVGTGSRILHVDETETPPVQTYGDFFAEADRDTVLGSYSGRLYAGDNTVLRELAQITAPLGIATSALVGSPPSVGVLAPFAGYAIRCMLEVDGELYIGLENVAVPTSSKIVAWNGLGAPKDDLTGIRPPQAMGKWRNKLVVGFDATAAHIRVREQGSSHPGTWNTVGLAGFVCATQQNAMAEEGAKLYIASGIDKIFTFDGTTLALARTVATCDATGSGVTAVALHYNMIHYLWNVAATFAPKIGRHDPDSSANEWVDSYKAIQGDQPNFVLGSSMVSFRGQLVCGARQNWIIATSPNDVLGAVTVLNSTGAPSSGSDIRQLVRFP